MYDDTVFLCSNEYPTLSMVIPVVNSLMHLLREMTGSLDVLRDVMIEKLEQRFGKIEDNDEYCYATDLDPRFKTVPFSRETNSVKTSLIALTVQTAQQKNS